MAAEWLSLAVVEFHCDFFELKGETEISEQKKPSTYYQTINGFGNEILCQMS